jgi:EAL domain-containing protein (putative c-di-GMP-specific phosphodiesterase class I)
VCSRFQPIVDLRRRVVVGYEALTRFVVDGQPFSTPDEWFLHAHELGLASQLEARALATALSHRSSLPRNCFLTVNIDPNRLGEPEVRDVFARQGHLGGVVIELTEHHQWRWPLFEAVLHRLRRDGALVAIDDAGAGYSGLQQILRVRPAIIKLDREIVRGIDTDEAKAALVEMMGVFANRIDAWILAEGIETMGEAQRLVDLEVPLVQGYLFGGPAEPWPALDPVVESTLEGFAETSAGQLHRLVDPVPPLTSGPTVMFEHASDDPWRAVVDSDDRPVGVIDAAAALSGELVQTLVANVHSTPAEVAQRLSTAGIEPGAPIAVTDDRGRYLGLVTVRRLLAQLGRG